MEVRRGAPRSGSSAPSCSTRRSGSHRRPPGEYAERERRDRVGQMVDEAVEERFAEGTLLPAAREVMAADMAERLVPGEDGLLRPNDSLAAAVTAFSEMASPPSFPEVPLADRPGRALDRHTGLARRPLPRLRPQPGAGRRAGIPQRAVGRVRRDSRTPSKPSSPRTDTARRSEQDTSRGQAPGPGAEGPERESCLGFGVLAHT